MGHMRGGTSVGGGRMGEGPDKGDGATRGRVII